MAPRIDDRWLWLGLGVFTFLATKAVSHGLKHILTLTTVTNPPPLPPHHPPVHALGKEDAIKTSSLQILATCPNIEIRKAATKILCERFVAHEPSTKHLLRDLQSRNLATKKRALRAWNLLRDYGVVRDSILSQPPATPRAHGRANPWRRVHGWDVPVPVRVGAGGAGSSGELRNGHNWQERDLRRRRREAMVINEGDRPISQEDVWMRDDEGRMSREEMERDGGGSEMRPFPPHLEEQLQRVAQRLHDRGGSQEDLDDALDLMGLLQTEWAEQIAREEAPSPESLASEM